MAYEVNIEYEVEKNWYFRKVLYTGYYSQLVAYCLQSGEDISNESYPKADQLIVIVSGAGKAVVEGAEWEVSKGSVVLVPAGHQHNIVNTGSHMLQLYSMYSPPQHRDGMYWKTKADAAADTGEHWTGSTTE